MVRNASSRVSNHESPAPSFETPRLFRMTETTVLILRSLRSKRLEGWMQHRTRGHPSRRGEDAAPQDEDLTSKFLRDLGQHIEQGDAVGGAEQFVQPCLVLGRDQLLGARQ